MKWETGLGFFSRSCAITDITCGQVVSQSFTEFRTDPLRIWRLQDFSTGVQKIGFSTSCASSIWCPSATLWEFGGHKLSLPGAWWSSAPQLSLAALAKSVAWLDLARVSFGLLPLSQRGQATDDQAANSLHSWVHFQILDTALPKLRSLPLVPGKGIQEIRHI